MRTHMCVMCPQPSDLNLNSDAELLTHRLYYTVKSLKFSTLEWYNIRLYGSVHEHIPFYIYEAVYFLSITCNRNQEDCRFGFSSTKLNVTTLCICYPRGCYTAM